MPPKSQKSFGTERSLSDVLPRRELRKRSLANHLLGYDQGIMPHSNILLATGAATLSMNIWRICGSLRRKFTASCSRCDFDCPRSCHSCSHEEFWYFWMTLLATLSNIGYWALLTPASSRTGSVSRVTRCSFDFKLHMVFSPFSFSFARNRCLRSIRAI